MSLSAAAIRIMAEKGLSALDIVEIAEALEVRRDPTAAVRQQRRRDKVRAERDGSQRDVTRDETPSLDKEKGTQKEIKPNPHTHTHEAPARKAGPSWPCPDGVEPKHWADFLANRKRKRLVNTETAREGVMTDLAEKADAQWPPGRLVQLAAAKGWGSIVYPNDEGPRNARPANNRNGTPATGNGRSIDAGFGFVSDGEPDRFGASYAH